MLLHERYSTLGTVITTILTIIGTAAALLYYLSIGKYNTISGFVGLFGGYFSVLLFSYGYFNKRLNKDV